MSGYRTDDITFCSHNKCRRKTCSRHPDNRINKNLPYSVADYENTKFCAKVNHGIDLDEFVPLIANDTKTRNKEMAFMRDCGFTFDEIGEKYGLSRQRVHQILNKKKKVRERKRK